MRSGDLRHDFLGSVRAVEGIRAHQLMQSRRPAEYMAEVPVSHTVDHPEFVLSVIGRIKEDVTWVKAESEMVVIAARLTEQDPNKNTEQSVRLMPVWSVLSILIHRMYPLTARRKIMQSS